MAGNDQVARGPFKAGVTSHFSPPAGPIHPHPAGGISEIIQTGKNTPNNAPVTLKLSLDFLVDLIMVKSGFYYDMSASCGNLIPLKTENRMTLQIQALFNSVYHALATL